MEWHLSSQRTVQMSKALINLFPPVVAAITVAWITPGFAQDTAMNKPETEVELLRAQLAARQAINEELSRRITSLEQQLAGQTKTPGPVSSGLDANFPKPAADAPRGAATTAIEEALVSKGLALMLSGSLRATSSITWAHSGSGANRADSTALGLTLETGLPGGMAAAVSAPYLWRGLASGTNNGLGDPSISVAKKLIGESGAIPSIILRMSYTHDSGKDPFTLPAVAAGFRAVGVSLSAAKRFDPLVLYGNVSYGHAFPKSVALSDKVSGAVLFQGRIAPGDAYGIGMGMSLAATPEIALDAGLSFSFANSSQFDSLNTTILPGRSTAGYLNLGTSILLTKNMSLSISAAAGVTRDASDFVFSVALPYRF